MITDRPDEQYYDPDKYNRIAWTREKTSLTQEEADVRYAQLGGYNIFRALSAFFGGLTIGAGLEIDSRGEITSTADATFRSLFVDTLSLNGSDIAQLISSKIDDVDARQLINDRFEQIMGGLPQERIDTILELGQYLMQNEDALAALTAQIATKASHESLELLSDRTDALEQEMQTKADIEYLDTVAADLLLKSDKTELENLRQIVDTKADKVAVSQLNVDLRNEIETRASIVTVSTLRTEHNALRSEHDVLRNEHDALRTEHDTLATLSEQRHGATQQQISELATAVVALESDKVDLETYNTEFAAVETEVNTLSTNITSLTTTVQNNLGLLQGQIDILADVKLDESALAEAVDAHLAEGVDIVFGYPPSFVPADPSFNDAQLLDQHLVTKGWVNRQFEELPLDFQIDAVEEGDVPDAILEKAPDNPNLWLLSLQLARGQGFRYMGEWQSNQPYKQYDIVRHDRDTFIKFTPGVVVSSQNPLDSDDWDYFSQGGLDGADGAPADSGGGSSLVSSLTSALISVSAGVLGSLVMGSIMSSFRGAMMDAIGGAVRNIADDAAQEAIDEVVDNYEMEEVKRRIRFIEASPYAAPVDYTSVNGRLRILDQSDILLNPTTIELIGSSGTINARRVNCDDVQCANATISNTARLQNVLCATDGGRVGFGAETQFDSDVRLGRIIGTSQTEALEMRSHMIDFSTTPVVSLLGLGELIQGTITFGNTTPELGAQATITKDEHLVTKVWTQQAIFEFDAEKGYEGKIGALEDRATALEEKMTAAEEKITVLEEADQQKTERLDAHDERLNVIEERLAEVFIDQLPDDSFNFPIRTPAEWFEGDLYDFYP